MKILLALCRPLFPQDTGGKIRTFNIFSRLAKRMEVHAISLVDKERESSAIPLMEKAFRTYTPLFWKETPKFSVAFYVELLANFVGHYPYFLAKYRVFRFREEASTLFARGHFDLLVCDGLPAGAAMLDSALRPRVVFERNVEYLIRKRHWEAETNALKKLVMRSEWKKAYSIERKVCTSFDHVVAVSDQDRDTFIQEFGIRHASSVPTGVDAEYFRPIRCEPREGNIVFIGSMDWYPNEDGIFWFVKEIFPRIRQAHARANLTVVGRNPSQRLLSAVRTGSSIEITGTVNDVRPFLAHAQAVIVPLRIGSGTRIKIFEAMAMARPVVSTTVGAEGLPVVPGREILIEDSPENFAKAVSEVLRNEAVRERIGAAARDKVLREHTWDMAAEKMGELLARVVEGCPSREEAVPPLCKHRKKVSEMIR